MATESESEELKATQTYCSIMDEIKFRIEWIKNVIHAKIMIAQTIGADLGYLELRMICELIALGCLVAHGDIRATRSGRLTESYEADLLIKALSKLHPEFYPQPMVRLPFQEPVPSIVGRKLAPPPPIKAEFLTQKDMAMLWRTCGARLHRGNLNDILAHKQIDSDFSPIGKAVDKIVFLLD
jgi:hypothetical protein